MNNRYVTDPLSSRLLLLGELRFSFVLVAQLGVLLEVSPRLLSYTDVHVNATPSVRRTASAPIVSGGTLVTPERYRLVTIGRMSPQAARYLELGCRLGASAIILR